MGNGYNTLVLLHLVCVIGGFGGLAYNGLTLALASRRGPDAVAVLQVNHQVSGLAELLVYGAALSGIAAVGASHSAWGFGQAWVSTALALYVVDLGLLHGLIRPAQRHYAAVAGELSKVTVSFPSERPQEVAVLDGLSRRISLGWGAFDLVVLVVVYLMIFKPGGLMHPIERLRYVARSSGADPALVAREAAGALADMALDEPAGLVPACRRLIGRHVTAGPVWWLSARMLGTDDPAAAAGECVAALDGDRTARLLADELPGEATVVVVGWPDTTASALRRRGDVEVLVVDGGGDGSVLARRLDEAGTPATAVPDAGVAAAVAVADLVLVEAHAAGPSGLLAHAGSHAAAAVAAAAGIPVWAVTPVGTVLPARLWDRLLSRVDAAGLEPWERETEVVPVPLLSSVVGPGGPTDVDLALRSSDAPPVAELLHDPR